MKPNIRAEWYLNGRSAADPPLCNLPYPPDDLIRSYAGLKTLQPDSDLTVRHMNMLSSRIYVSSSSNVK